MQLILEIVEGPGSGRRIVLTPGQVATIGRTEYADYSFTEIPEMSSTHFQLTCEADVCKLRDLNSLNGTVINGERITDAVLANGDLIKVGQTIFRVRLGADAPVAGANAPAANATVALGSQGISALSPSPKAASEPPGETAPSPLAAESGFLDCSVPETCEQIQDLGEEAKTLARDDLAPREFAEMLVEKGLLEDAVRYTAYALCKRSAVQWACGCVRAGIPDLGEDDVAALEIAEKWSAEPNDDDRRSAQAAAEKLEHATPASWVAMGAFLSEGSLAPPDAPVIAPAPHLTGHCIAGAVMLAGVAETPEKAPEKFRQFVAAGVEPE